MIALGITFVVLVIATWLYTMYVSWKEHTGATFEPIEKSLFVQRWAQVLRLIRRAWYSANAEGKHLLHWSGKHAEQAFVKVFPNAAPVFTKHDELTGLKQGPSSYFLKSISPTQPSKTSRSPRAKKDDKMVGTPE